ncbi:OLC1v1009403C1 [Oldenlandia corymbosa var. corymbosa]|uniref:OLC1v1009403C1 n=1 Tax=Oldenlandia corymbosa var. corymbosa TaxID=529605 RepID=A0AAV1DRS1_OLDCO|nr:OLC1v1009403C1 [Oldenlandia corymbosa var. corymbosa]
MREVSFFFFYVKTHVKIINACIVLHNLIRIEAPNDPMLDEVDAELLIRNNQDDDAQGGEDDEDTQPVHGGEDEEDSPHVHGAAQNSSRITVVQFAYEWSQFRDSIAEAMFREYQNRRSL